MRSIGILNEFFAIFVSQKVRLTAFAQDDTLTHGYGNTLEFHSSSVGEGLVSSCFYRKESSVPRRP